jgi:hypothetical protein
MFAKCKAIITNVIAPFATKQIDEELKEARFISVLIDSSNHLDKKLVPLVVRYYAEKGMKVKVFGVLGLLNAVAPRIQWKCHVPRTTAAAMSFGRAKAQVVSRRPLTAETRVRARANPSGICGGQSGTGTGFSPSSLVFPVNISFHHRSPN